MSFFVKSRKRKPTSKDPKFKTKKPFSKQVKALNEEIESESDVDSTEATENRNRVYSSDDEDIETAEQKRLRLAKDYLSKLEEEEAEKKEDEEILKDAVSSRLRQDISEQAGKVVHEVAKLCVPPDEADIRRFRGHQLAVTAIVLSQGGRYAFTASKDCNICKWDVREGLKVKTLKGGRKGTEATHIGHTNHILCLAISSDDQFLAAGDMCKLIKLWNPEDLSFIHKFQGHRGAVTGLAFRKGSHSLFSCSMDRVVKVWNVDELAYVETLFGHNSPITGIDSLTRDRAITSGGSDKSVHIWKIPEDSQLLFHGHGTSIECVALINEMNFFTGAEDSSLCLWSVMRKKPNMMHKHAHRIDGDTKAENWISAVASHQYSDLVASGSRDGFVRLWKCGPEFKSLSPLFSVPVKGFVNSLCFSQDGSFLVAGVGQEHRLGRWWRLKDAKNGWVIIPLRTATEAADDEMEEEEEEGKNDVEQSEEEDGEEEERRDKENGVDTKESEEDEDDEEDEDAEEDEDDEEGGDDEGGDDED